MFFERGGKLPDPNFSQVTATFSGSPGDSSDAIREHRENEETCIKGMVPNGHHHNQGDDSLSSRTTSSGNQDVDEYVKTKATQGEEGWSVVVVIVVLCCSLQKFFLFYFLPRLPYKYVMLCGCLSSGSKHIQWTCYSVILICGQ